MFFKNVVDLEDSDRGFFHGIKIVVLEIVSLYYLIEYLVLSKKWQREARIKRDAS